MIRVETENLRAFKRKVDGILGTLEGSDAAPPAVGWLDVTQHHLGSGFGESADLSRAYEVVRENLQTLSQALADQIEAMSIAVDIAANGYQHVDEGHRETLWRIRHETDVQHSTPLRGGLVARPDGAPAAAGHPDGR